MVLLASILTVTGYSGMPPATRAGFEALGRRTDRLCPARHVRTITPGDLDYLQDGFERSLSRLDRARLLPSIPRTGVAPTATDWRARPRRRWVRCRPRGSCPGSPAMCVRTGYPDPLPLSPARHACYSDK